MRQGHDSRKPPGQRSGGGCAGVLVGPHSLIGAITLIAFLTPADPSRGWQSVVTPL